MSENVELRIVGEIGSVRLQEGDRLLITSPNVLTHEQSLRIRDIVKKVFGDYPVVIIDSGMKIEVMRPVEA